MNEDIRALLIEAASGAPSPPPLRDDLRARVRARRAGRIGVTMVTAAALVAGSVAVAGRVARSIDVARRVCDDPWTVAPFAVASRNNPSRTITPVGGVIAGPDDVWLTANDPGGVDGKGSTAIVHGDGRTWERRDLSDGTNAQISTMAADRGVVWAAGYRAEYQAAGDKTTLHPVLYRFDGTAWRAESLPTLLENSPIRTVAVRGDRIVAGGSTTVAERRDGAWYQVSETAFLIERTGGVWRARSLPDLRGDYSVDRIVIDRDGRLILETRGRGGVGIVVEDGDGWNIVTPPGKPIVWASVRATRDMWAVRPFVVAEGRVELLRYDGRSWSVRSIELPGMVAVRSITAGAAGRAWLTALAHGSESLQPPLRRGGPLYPRQSHIFRLAGKKVVEEPVAWPGDVRSVAIADVDDVDRGLAVGSYHDSKSVPHPIVLTRCVN